MNYNRVLYHGTDKESAKNIIATGKFKPSEGNGHWLGNGIYFYEEEFHAFKWLKYLKKKKEKRKNITIDDGDILNYYSIVKVEVDIDESKVFDLTKIEYKLEFERIYKWINKKTKLSNEFRERLEKNGACAEGVIFNFMFEQTEDFELNYSEDYDLVRALFPIPHWKYNNILKEEIKSGLKYVINRKNYERRKSGKPPLNLNKMNLDDLIGYIAESLNNRTYIHRKYRITFMPEIQICIKNPNILKKGGIVEHECKDRLDELLMYVEMYGRGLHNNKLEEGKHEID